MFNITISSQACEIWSKFNNIDKDGIYECKCEICPKTEYFDYRLNNEYAYAEDLYHQGWKTFNGILYCPKCYEQLEALNNTNKIKRPSKIQYYINIAKEVASRSTCLRRKYGCVIVKHDAIISTGYNGAAHGLKNCNDVGECRREKMNVPRGTCYELCRSVHSEVNAIINASKEQLSGATMYLCGVEASTNNMIEDLNCCEMCKRVIINSGIIQVVLARPNEEFKLILISEWINNDESLTEKIGY